jgi:hypothetical protein
MLLAFRLAGLSALGTYYAGVDPYAQMGTGSTRWRKRARGPGGGIRIGG